MNVQPWFRSCLALLLILALSVTVCAQGGGNTGGGNTGGGNTGGGNTGGGNTGGGNTGGGNTGGGNTGGGNPGTGTGTGTGTGNNGQSTGQRQGQQEFDSSLDLGLPPVEIPDARNSGFVGPTSDAVRENGFVGASSPAMGSVPQTTNANGLQGAGAGGTGTGNRAGGAGAGGARNTGGAAGLAGNRGVGGLGGAGQGRSNSFQVNRSPLRTGLTNRIQYTPATPQQMVARFQSRVNRNLALPQSGYQVSVAQGVATVVGEVDSPQAAERIESQLRLEPGVYRINNQLKVRN